MALLTLSAICDQDRETLESWLVAFEQAWTEDALAEWVANRLPAPGNPLRQAALTEMIKIDLERQWQGGRQRSLGWYWERYRERGTLETVSAELVFAEYQVRQQFGAAADLADYARRFPAQAAELARLAEAAADHSLPPLSLPPPSPAAELDTPRAGLASETASPHTAAATELPENFGRYRIVRKLGQGGMGAVCLAHDTQLDRQVALKVPSFVGSDRKEMVERFLREARAMATITHPNLCPVHDVGEIGGVHFMTMGYIEGRLLAEHIQSGQPAGERLAATVIRKLALALHEAHTRGVVHRDLKPTNIFIDPRGEPVIVDFGLARRVEASDAALTHNGTLVGTPAYMAPEQARGQASAIGPQSDIYSLGVILYELLTSRRPFRGEGALEVLGQVLTGQPDPPRAVRPDIDPRLEAICLKAMAKQPADRYASMAELAAALGDFQAATIQAGASGQASGTATDHTPAASPTAGQRGWTRPAPRPSDRGAGRKPPTAGRTGTPARFQARRVPRADHSARSPADGQRQRGDRVRRGQSADRDGVRAGRKGKGRPVSRAGRPREPAA